MIAPDIIEKILIEQLKSTEAPEIRRELQKKLGENFKEAFLKEKLDEFVQVLYESGELEKMVEEIKMLAKEPLKTSVDRTNR